MQYIMIIAMMLVSTFAAAKTREEVYKELVESKHPKPLPKGAVTDPFSPAYGFVSTKTRQEVINEMMESRKVVTR